MEFDYALDVNSDLGELWDTNYFIDSESLMICKDEDWACRQTSVSSGSPGGVGVVLRDRLMTDAALGGPKPIKAEHSYSLLACSSPPRTAVVSGSLTAGTNTTAATVSPHLVKHTRNSTNSTTQQQQHHHHHHRVELTSDVFTGTLVCANESSQIDVTDMEEECYPAISMNTASGRGSSRSSPEPYCRIVKCGDDDDEEDDDDDRKRTTVDLEDEAVDVETCPTIKGEPVSAPCSPDCTSNPSMLLDAEEEDKSTVAISPHSLHITRFNNGANLIRTIDSEDEDEEMLHEFKVEAFEMPCDDDDDDDEDAELKQTATMVTLMDHTATTTNTEQELLPPTPPSSASSDSEGTVSASCSPERRDSHGSVHVQGLRGFTQPRLYVTNSAVCQSNAGATATRQPIHTPLISCQPKGSTGVLVLTEEEKRTLIAEGYPVPTRLPLSKQEEKSLKKVRRKIKNKISAQESRRKKKEYMDGLERKVSLLVNENNTYKDKVVNLENTNRQLMKELQRLQALVQQSS